MAYGEIQNNGEQIWQQPNTEGEPGYICNQSERGMSPRARIALTAAGLILVGTMVGAALGIGGIQAGKNYVRENMNLKQVTTPLTGQNMSGQNDESLPMLGNFGQGN